MIEEKWKPIEGYVNYYEVSNWGRVRSCNRIIIKKNGVFHRRKGRILSAHKNVKNGLLQVMLILHTRYKLFYVHRLVAQAFVNNPYSLELVSHKNGNDLDNRAENLIFISRSAKKNKELKLTEKA